jgi:GntR family transcriptional regulator/MocR family aminotransferase
LAAEVLVELRRDDRTALHRQLEVELRSAIRSGRLTPGSALPSTRTLAEQLSISRGAVVEAYEQLVAEGYLQSRHGGGTRVASRVAEPVARPSTAHSTRVFRFDFAYGRPDVTLFPRQEWLRSVRRVLNEAPSARLGYLDGRGAPELHDALATYLNRVRRTVATPDRIVICNGFAQGLHLALSVLRVMGARRVAVEDPGQNDTPAVAHHQGLDVETVAVDEDGIDVDALVRVDPDAVVVTSAHQFPMGGVLPPDRRDALVRWAAERPAFIIEDDYDAEYRYDREPIGAIQGLAPERVIYAGTASKVLAPGLRLGWIVAPRDLVDRLADAKEMFDRGSAAIEQLAFADFVARGGFDHHLRRMRPLYRRRRDRLLDALARLAPDLRPVGASAGAHLVTMLPDDVDEAAVVERAADLDVLVYGLRRYRLGGQGGPGGPGGLVFGYGGITESDIEQGIALIAQAVAASRPEPGGVTASHRVPDVLATRVGR